MRDLFHFERSIHRVDLVVSYRRFIGSSGNIKGVYSLGEVKKITILLVVLLEMAKVGRKYGKWLPDVLKWEKDTNHD